MKSDLFFRPLVFSALLFSAFQIKTVASESSKSAYAFTGTLYPQQTTKISSQVQGRMLTLYADVGDFVKKDQVVAELDSLFYAMDVEKIKILADQAKLAFEESEVEYTRMKKLWEKHEGESPAISKKQYEEACHRYLQRKLSYEQALVEVERVKSTLEETRIKAPYDGVITGRFVDPGEAITVVPVTPIFEIMDVAFLRLEFSLPQDFLPLVKVGQEIALEKGLRGTIEKIFPHVDVSSRCFKCRVKMENTQGSLKPGQFVRGTLPIKKALVHLQE